MGVPSVLPSNVPERISTLSASLRGETIFDWPGRRRSRSGWISAGLNSSRGGQPSTTTPTPPPWDSPQLVTRNRRPKLFAMEPDWGKTAFRSNSDRPGADHPPAAEPVPRSKRSEEHTSELQHRVDSSQ